MFDSPIKSWPSTCYCLKPFESDEFASGKYSVTILPCGDILCSYCVNSSIYCPECYTVIPHQYDFDAELWVNPWETYRNEAERLISGHYDEIRPLLVQVRPQAIDSLPLAPGPE